MSRDPLLQLDIAFAVCVSAAEQIERLAELVRERGDGEEHTNADTFARTSAHDLMSAALVFVKSMRGHLLASGIATADEIEAQGARMEGDISEIIRGLQSLAADRSGDAH